MPKWGIVWRAAVVTFAVGIIGFIYWMGLLDVAGALVLSGLLVLILLYIRSGALAPVSLLPRHSSTLRNSARWEFSKALICAGAGLDLIRLIVFADTRFLFVLNHSVTSEAAVLVVIAVWLLGTGAFLVRSFAAYLLSLRP